MSEIRKEYGGDEDQAIAGLLHDAVEDQGGEPRLNDIRNRFGKRVADIVQSCSDSMADTAAGQPKEDWHVRKQRYHAPVSCEFIEQRGTLDPQRNQTNSRRGAFSSLSPFAKISRRKQARVDPQYKSRRHRSWSA